jgi:hypothetical protein
MQHIAKSIAANPDSALVDIEGFDLYLYADVLGVLGDIRDDNRTILARVQAQRSARRRVKSARGGTK